MSVETNLLFSQAKTEIDLKFNNIEKLLKSKSELDSNTQDFLINEALHQNKLIDGMINQCKKTCVNQNSLEEKCLESCFHKYIIVDKISQRYSYILENNSK